MIHIFGFILRGYHFVDLSSRSKIYFVEINRIG
jgi:hypothetical protein